MYCCPFVFIGCTRCISPNVVVCLAMKQGCDLQRYDGRVNRGKTFMFQPRAVHGRASESVHAAHTAEALVPAWTSFQYRRQALHKSTSQLTATARATSVGQIAPPRCEGERSVPLSRTGGTNSPGSARDHSQATPSRSAGVSLAIALRWRRRLSCPCSHALKARIIPWETSLMA